jgi:hypothetical protein
MYKMDQVDDPCVEPRDGDNPLIWSCSVGTPPFSILVGSTYERECPPPTYIKVSDLNAPKDISHQALLQGHVIQQEGGLIFTDQRVLNKQSGIILDVIKKVAACLIKGKGIVGLSLPIRLFEPRSTLERLLDRWSHMSHFFVELENMDRLERFKRVIAMGVSGLYVRPSQEKPFNPLLGETLQAHWPDGTQAYCEHTSHHPPITNFLVLGKFFKMHGHCELTGRFKKNSLHGGLVGTTHVSFEDGQSVSFEYPAFRAGGMLFGDRTANYEGTMEFLDARNGFKAEIKFGPERKKSVFRKAIGKLDDFKGVITYNGAQVCEIEGSWLRNLVIDGVEYWNTSRQSPVFHLFPSRPLPSDWRYREDLVWLFKGNSDISERWKHRIENRQRHDRVLRADHEKHK